MQKREKEFDEYRQERVVQAKLDYRELLKETKIITYKCVASSSDLFQFCHSISDILVWYSFQSAQLSRCLLLLLLLDCYLACTECHFSSPLACLLGDL